MKGNTQQTSLFNTTELCRLPFGPQTAHADCHRHCASEKKPTKTDPLSVACFEWEIWQFFMYYCVHSEKLNLQSWAISQSQSQLTFNINSQNNFEANGENVILEIFTPLLIIFCKFYHNIAKKCLNYFGYIVAATMLHK